jgi:hypothetical protein
VDVSWLDDNTFIVLFAGIGCPLVGLAGILLRGARHSDYRPRHVFAISAVVFVFIGALMAWFGRPFHIWASPLALALLSGAIWMMEQPATARVAQLILGLLRQPLFQCSLFIALGPLAAFGWSTYCAAPDVYELPGYLVNEPKLAPYSPYRTDRGRVVPQLAFEAAEEERAKWEREMAQRGPVTSVENVFRISEPDFTSNCHGWVFTGGKALLRGREIEIILEDNGYQPVTAPQRGDLIVYRTPTGDVIHTGLVHLISVDGEIQIQSKWGCDSRYLHPPQAGYTGVITYYRSNRQGHLLQVEPDGESIVGAKPALATHAM